MDIYLFWSERDPEVFGFTSYPDGGNLPAELAPWTIFGNGEPLPHQEENGPVINAIRRDGFYLARSALLGALPHQGTVH